VQPFVWYGRNAITAFFFSSLLATASVYLRVPLGPHAGQAIKRFLYQQLFASWAGPLWGSLLYAIGVVVLWALICGELHRRRKYWKI
jgi:predicted acyltransferase